MDETTLDLCRRVAYNVSERVSAITDWHYELDRDSIVVRIPLDYDRALRGPAHDFGCPAGLSLDHQCKCSRATDKATGDT